MFKSKLPPSCKTRVVSCATWLSVSLSWTTLPRLVCTDITCSPTEQPWDILWCHYWFCCEMGSENCLQKFHTSDVSLPVPRSGLLVLMIHWSKFPFRITYQKHYPDLASGASSVWNFCRRPRCHFAGKPVVVELQNVGSFLRLHH